MKEVRFFFKRFVHKICCYMQRYCYANFQALKLIFLCMISKLEPCLCYFYTFCGFQFFLSLEQFETSIRRYENNTNNISLHWKQISALILRESEREKRSLVSYFIKHCLSYYILDYI